MKFRKATLEDLDCISGIYDRIHDGIENGQLVIGWKRDIYPTRETARAAIIAGDMFVELDNGVIVASGRINQEQVDVYSDVTWDYPAPDDKVMVLHTLTVDPVSMRKGYGSAFVAFYEDYASEHGCPYLRMDTNGMNTVARKLYNTLGYKEVGIVPCVFNGIPGVPLVMLEKKYAERRQTNIR